MTANVLDGAQIAARLNGHANGASSEHAALCEQLTEDLGLDTIGVKVTGAAVFGRGEDALVDVYLGAGSRPLHFKRYGRVSDPRALSTALVTQTGIHKTFKAVDAGAIAGAIFRLADHHAESDADDAAREWGFEYLRIAPTQDVVLGDQADRWRAFSSLARMAPARDAGEDRSAHALAAASIVLVDPATGRRLVRAGWFQAYVKREVGGLYSPAALVQQMQRVGWSYPGGQGRVKATCPTDERKPLAWAFYLVDADWGADPVTAGSSSYARVRTHTRGTVETPAVTRNREAVG